MNTDLLNILVKKKIIRTETEVEVLYNAVGLGGQILADSVDVFTVIKIVKKPTILLLLQRNRDGHTLETTANNIKTIDGMDPARLAEIYNVNPDGSKMKIRLDEFGNPIRRGRKPKHIIEENKRKKKKQGK